MNRNDDYDKENGKPQRTAIIGGTFDTLHQGHKEYITLAFDLAQQVYILLRTDEYAQIPKQYKVKPFQVRLDQLENFIIKEIRCQTGYSIHPMDSQAALIDFCLNHEISLAITAPEYYSLFERINRLRELEKKKSLLILIKERTRTPEGFDLNSTSLNGITNSKKSVNSYQPSTQPNKRPDSQNK